MQHLAALDPQVAQLARHQPLGFVGEQARQVPFGRGQHQLAVLAAGIGVDDKAETLEVADMLALDRHPAVVAERHPQQCRILAHGLDQYRASAVDETLGQPLVQRVGQARFGGARARRHLVAGQDPVGPLADIGPAADRGDAALQGVDIALRPVELGNASGDVIGPQVAFAQVLPQPGDEAGMRFRALLAKVGQLANLPQAANHPGSRDAASQRRVFGQPLEHREVDRFGGGGELRGIGPGFEIGDEHGNRFVARLGLAPEEVRQRGEAMFFDRVDLVLGELGAAARFAPGERAEGPVLLVAPGAPGDLGHFRRDEPSLATPVEFAQRGEGDVGDVKVEPHADRVGGDDVVDLARLEQLDLAVARLGAQRTHHHRSPAAEPAQHLGHRVDLLGREGDQRRARRQAAELGRTRMGERGEARAGLDPGLRHQRADHRLEGRRAEQHRLLPAASVEQPVGEDVPALGIGGELRLVERDESRGAAAAPARLVRAFSPNRHRLGRAQQVAGIGGLDPLLAGDQRDLALALDRADLVVDLARQQAQREADRPARMATHPLDRQVGLAGIGRTENGAHPAVGVESSHYACECGRSTAAPQARSTARRTGDSAHRD